MDIKSMNSLLELQALQTVGTTANNSTYSSTSAFTELISAFLNQSSTSNHEVVNQLGSLQSLLGDQLQKNAPISTSFLNAPMTYGSEFKTQSNVEQYKTPDYTGATAYSSILAGAQPFQELIQKASEQYDVPEKLIASVMKQESNFNTNAVSHAGATGLMQLMPATARYLGVNDSTDPEQNIMGGAKYLRKMLDQFDNNISTALAAYNAGPGNVKKYNGIPPFKETQNYVKKVLNYYQT